MKKIFFSCLILLAGLSMIADNGWSAGWQPSKVFIENKGQFPKVNNLSVEYAIDYDRTKIYFSSTGLTYAFFKSIPKDKEEEEREKEREGRQNFKTAEEWLAKEKEEHNANIKRDYVNLIWENANPNAKITASEQADEYFSYSFKEGEAVSNINYIKGFKKIMYKDLYPNIDVEYTFHPTEGIKYALILHPGADISMVKMKYTDANKISINAGGDLHIRTEFGDIIDHAPVTFYANNNSSLISSKFIKNGNSISFELENYDKSQTIVIDPWTQTPTLNNSNGVWECEKDGAGNVYIIGGDMPMKLLKYNAAGALQWTYTTPWDTSNAWLGTLATDLAGNSYVTSGSIAALQKVNVGGGLVWSYTAPAFSVDEYWSISFNCDQTKLIVAGTTGPGFPSTQLNGCIFDINTTNGNIISKTIIGAMFNTIPPYINEGRSLTDCHNGRYYYLTLDTIGCIDQNFSACSNNSSIFAISSGYKFAYKCENYRPKNGNAGIKSIRANKNFVYTANGTNIQKRSLATGAVINSVAIPGGISTTTLGRSQIGNSGIDLDSCGNVYVGSGNKVIKYDANLNLLTSVALSFAVYDVAVSTAGDVIVCGATGTSSTVSRTGSVQSIPMSSCASSLLVCCDANVCPAGPFCTTSPNYTLTPATAGGTWSGTGVNASGVFNPSTAGPGTHTIVYTLPCGNDSINIVVNPCATLSVCITGSTLSVSGGTPGYTWQTQTTVSSCTACVIGCTFPPGCSTTVTSWTTVATGTSTFTPGSYPVKVFDSGGNSYTITTSGSVPTCTTACTTPTVSFSGVTNVSCKGGTNGGATATASPAGTYTYTWQGGNLNGATQSALSAGVYTVTANAGGGCSSTATVSITEPNLLTITPVQTSSVTCFGLSNGTASVTISGGTPSYTVNWSSGGTGTSTGSLPVGTVTASVTDSKTCVATGTVTITGPSDINIQQLSTNALCGASNGSASVTAVGGTAPLTYSWSTGATGNVLSGVAGGTYTAYVTDGNSCTKTATVTINSTGGPTATAAQTSSVTCNGLTNGTASVSISGGTPSYTVNWSGGGTGTTIGGLGAGTYTATVTDSNSCVTTTTVTIDAPPAIVITFTNNSPSACTANTGSVTANASGGTGVLTYTWNTGASGQTLGNVSAGIYTVTVTDANSCTQQASVSISTVNGPTVTPVATATVSCNGGSNGTASVSITGGTPTYTVNWSSGASGTSVTGLSGGIYTITVTDAASCVTIDTVSIAQPPSITVTVNGSPTGCTNSVGTATANATGGTGVMTYTWSNSQTGATASGLGIGVYTVTATDANSCVNTNTVSIGVTNSPTVTVSGSPTGCTNSIGTATANATGGNGVITYTWSNSQSGATASGLGVGVYTVTATDTNGCANTNTVSIGVTANPTVTVSESPTGCTNTIGSATASATGGTGVITYTWSNSQTGATATGLGQNTYTVIGTDANGCIGTNTVSIGVTPSPTVTIDSTHNVKCNGQANGTAYASVTGGTPGYGMSWSNGAAGIAATNLANGSYTIVVTDANGCKDSAATIISQPQPLSDTTTNVQAENCNLSNGAATVNTNGGTPNYTYQWSSGQTTQIVSNFSTGTYTVVIKDAHGCKDSTKVIIANIAGPTATLIAQTDVTCNGLTNGTATVTANGGTPGYIFNWNNGSIGSSVDSLSSGIHIVTVKDAAGCTYTLSININQPNVLAIAPSFTPAGCSGASNGVANASISGGTSPYSISWSNGQTGVKDTLLIAGVYTVTATDINNCTATNTVVITENQVVDTLQITGDICLNDPTVVLTAPNGNGVGSPYQWTLSYIPITGATGLTYTGNSSVYTNYSVIWFYHGCRYITSSVFVTVTKDLGDLPQTNIFTPNDDKLNDDFIPFSTAAIPGGNSLLATMIENYELTIYDRWGLLLFQATTVGDSWNGKTNEGKDATPGTYYWIAKFKVKCSKNTGQQTLKGFVQLIR